MTEHVSHVVIGAGAMGLAATWRLAQRGIGPLALEQFDRGHTGGASHGATRNFNNAYTAPHYLDLLHAARAGWDDLSRTVADPLLRLHGLATHGNDADVAAIAAALTERGAHAEVWSPRDASIRWSGMRFDGDVLVSMDAGVVRAAAALAALENASIAAGAEVRFGHRVLALDETESGIRVTVQHGDTTYDVHAETVIVTAGAWTTRVLHDRWALPPLTVTEENPAHFAERNPGGVWPSFNHLLRPDERYPGVVYGMPAPGEGIKVGFHRVGPEIDPEAHRNGPSPELDAALRDYVREWTPGLAPEHPASITCTYTSTDTGDFVLDRRGRIVVGAGFSGHGFKFTPAVGAVLADLATDPSVQAPEPFRVGS